MKKIIVFAALLFISQLTFAQYALSKGESQLNAGVGLSSWGVPVYVGFDVGVHPDISVGGELSFRSYRENFRGDRYNHNIIGISGNGNYHFNTILDIPREWDFYAGLNLGFYVWSTPNDDYPGDGSSGLGLGAQIGGRYYFNDRFAVNLELGGGNAFGGGKFGISLKL
ncbi:MAG: outer membrane beta-barrel protein [Cyclobacteriaceae bacterium]|nr:outer membrane beta-barrel protein [Cyclobacteriaceae bacterium]